MNEQEIQAQSSKALISEILKCFSILDDGGDLHFTESPSVIISSLLCLIQVMVDKSHGPTSKEDILKIIISSLNTQLDSLEEK